MDQQLRNWDQGDPRRICDGTANIVRWEIQTFLSHGRTVAEVAQWLELTPALVAELIEGYQFFPMPYLPSPEQIRENCEIVQRGWTKEDETRRRAGSRGFDAEWERMPSMVPTEIFRPSRWRPGTE